MKTINLVALVFGAFAFHFIFWGEDLGLNCALLSLFSILINYSNSPIIFGKRTVQIVMAGHLISLIFFLYHHSLISEIAAIITWVVMIGFFQYSDLRTTHRALLSGFINFFRMPPVLSGFKLEKQEFSSFRFEREVKIILVPLVGLLVFYLIFREANNVFRSISDQFWHDVQWFFMTLFSKISLPRITFFVFGFLLCSWFIYQVTYGFFSEKEKNKTDGLFRIRKRISPTSIKAYGNKPGLGTDLKVENRTGVIMMAMIGILLVFINILDIIYVWFGYDFNPETNFSADVHKGLNLLIFSIFLSIFTMIYYFRKNQNFYSNNARLKKTAYFWIIQNFILIVSVVFRNIHYIQYQGLTHKRIGVFLFLLIVSIGLVSLYRKIAEKKSFFYMSRVNSWSVYGLLVFLACFNWDMIIFNYNFNHRSSIEFDRYYTLDYLSDEAILKMKFLESELNIDNDLNEIENYQQYRRNTLEDRIQLIKWQLVHDKTSFFSWNYRKYRLRKLFPSQLDAQNYLINEPN
ncbi:MAG: DUF4173 domain-containing protein [Crocinitomicaceae bacterium]